MDAIDLCKKLVSIDTTHSNNGDLVRDVIEKYLREKGGRFEVEEFEKDGIKSFLFISGDGKIVFNGHYDVVPANDWREAFFPTIREGMLYGRGAGDMKAGLSAMVDAFSKLSSNGHDVALMVVGDEEKGGFKGTKHVIEEWNIKPERVFVGEATSTKEFGDTIKNGRRGIHHLSMRIKGKGGHGSRPSSLNPSRAVKLIMDFIESYPFEKDERMVPTTVAVTRISMDGKAFNVIPESVDICMDMRYNMATSPEKFDEDMKQMLEEEGFHVEIDYSLTEPFFFNPSRRFEQELTEVMKGLGYSPRFSTSGGSSDARFFSGMGIPVLELGTRSSNAHARDEHVPVDDIQKLSDVLVKYVKSFERI